jgi:hypothetical protein
VNSTSTASPESLAVLPARLAQFNKPALLYCADEMVRSARAVQHRAAEVRRVADAVAEFAGDDGVVQRVERDCRSLRS